MTTHDYIICSHGRTYTERVWEPVPAPPRVPASPGGPCLVSVIIPTYHRPALLRRAIASVLREPLGDCLQVVVIDNGGDNLQPFADPRVEMRVYTERHSIGYPRNMGLRHARGEYVYYLDDDDVLVRGGLSKILAAYPEHPDKKLIRGRRWFSGRQGAGWCYNRQSQLPVWPRKYALPIWNDKGFGQDGDYYDTITARFGITEQDTLILPIELVRVGHAGYGGRRWRDPARVPGGVVFS